MMFRTFAKTATKILSAAALVALANTALAQDQTQDPAQTPAQTIEIPDMREGNPDAKVTVIEYASFTCPHCANFHKNQYQDIKKNYIDTGKINFVYREIYFDRYGLWASMIARCDESKFFGIADLVYRGQKEWATGTPAQIVENLRKYGRVAGLSDAQLDTCLTDADKAQALFAWYQKNSTEDDIPGTPTFMINGTQYSNMNYADFAKILDEKLAE